MLLILYQYDLGRGIKAESTIDLRVKYGSLEAHFPIPTRAHITHKDDQVIFNPCYSFSAGRKSIELHYAVIFPPGLKDKDGKVIPVETNYLMGFSIYKGTLWKSCVGHFRVELDDSLEGGMEIYRLENQEKIPCSIERKRKNANK